MAWQFNPVSDKLTTGRTVTTLLTSLWGFMAACLLFDALLVHHSFTACIAASMPLLIVWATLERKRWGRQSLIGLSLMTPALLGVCALLPHRNSEPSAWQSAVQPHGGTAAVIILLFLAAVSLVWLYTPAAIAEFERGKRANLARAQHLIAIILVGGWTLALLAPPFAPRLFHNVIAAPSVVKALLISPANAAAPHSRVLPSHWGMAEARGSALPQNAGSGGRSASSTP